MPPAPTPPARSERRSPRTLEKGNGGSSGPPAFKSICHLRGDDRQNKTSAATAAKTRLERCRSSTRRCVYSRHEIRKLRMLAQVIRHEAAAGDHLQSIGPHLVERALDQPGAHAFAAELWRHFGMHECDDAVGYLVIGRGNMAVGLKFVAVMCSVVGNRVVHIIQFLAVLPRGHF